MVNYNYQRVEELFSQLLDLLLTVFVDSEKSEVQEFIDAGEYGLALETLVDIIIEEEMKISSDALMLVYDLAEIMQLDKDVFEMRLRNHVVDG